MAFRWVDDMITDKFGTDSQPLDSVMFTDLQVRYNPAILDDALTVAVGFNNLFDEDPPLCDPCGSTNMSLVAHDLPGTIGYIRVTYQSD